MLEAWLLIIPPLAALLSENVDWKSEKLVYVKVKTPPSEVTPHWEKMFLEDVIYSAFEI